MKISDILSENRISIDIRSRNKIDVIQEMVELLANSDSILDSKEVLECILSREKAMTTGIGNGIAIPHGKCNYVKKMIASLGIARDGIPFEAIDGKPVNIIFTLITPLGLSGPHIKALSIISKLLGNENTRKKLIECKTPKDIFSLLEKEEGKIK